MLTTIDKAWLAAALALAGQYAQTKLGLPISPEWAAIITGAGVYLVPNKPS